MSLLDLKSLVSNEDFADAHEPLNDGVKEVPNAQTVAASVKTGDVGKDTTTQGPAKIVPEKPDTDDQTKTEHNVVKESAERNKSGSSEKPPVSPPGSKPNSAIPPTKDDSEEATSEVDADELEHTTKKSAEDELDKTEKATKSLEAYAPNARRFDIIGHPSRKAEEIGKMVSFLHRKAGGSGKVTVSAESIDAAIGIGRIRIAKLEREVRLLDARVSNEDIADSMGIDNPAVVEEAVVTAAPTEHGAPPMAPEAAAALTEAEIDPLDVPLLEIQRVQETVQTLEAGAAAIEQYREIIRANPRMSKQAAAVLHAGLEHIDLTCSLRARSTGLEAYVTTPRASMEEADAVSEKSLGDRAAEIGAKILEWLKKLAAEAVTKWEEYRVGLTSLLEKIRELEKKKFNQHGSIELRPVPSALFIEGDFVGGDLTPDERELPRKLETHYKQIAGQITRRVSTLLDKAEPSDIEQTIKAMRPASGDFAELPGDKWLVSEDGKLKFTEGKPETPDSFHVDDGDINPRRILGEMYKSIEQYQKLTVANLLKDSASSVTAALIKYRKGKGKDLDEAEFQKVQQAVVDNSIKVFDVSGFFDILRHVGALYNARYKLCAQLVSKD